MLRHALRQLWRAPFFTLIAAISLGVGIAVAVTAFSLLNSVLFKPLPVPDPGEIVHLYSSYGQGTYLYNPSALDDLEDYAASGVFSSVAAYESHRVTITADGREGRRANTHFVSARYFQTLQLPLVEGRAFNESDGNNVVILSERFRDRMFGKGSNVIGTTVMLDQHPFTVIGVAPANFRGLDISNTAVSAFVPAAGLEQFTMVFEGPQPKDRTFRWWSVVGRLAPGMTKEAASVRLAGTAQTLAHSWPVAWRDLNNSPLRITLLDHRASILKTNGEIMLILIGAGSALVAVVLLLACTNVAGLLLARTVARRHEIAVRLSLGAGRWRLISQFALEAVLLSLTGAVVGCVFAAWLLRIAVQQPVFESFDLSMDWRVLLAAIGFSLLCALIFGITPAGQALRVDVKSGLSGVAIVGERRNVRGRLIAMQISLSCLLLIIAFTASRGVSSRLYTGAGFDFDGLVIARPDMSGFFRGPTAYSPANVTAYLDRIRATLNGSGNVRAFTFTPDIPFDGTETRAGVNLELPAGRTFVRQIGVGVGYFETMGIPLLRGRTITAEDTTAHIVAVVNRAFVEQHGADVGQVLISGPRQIHIIGVVDNMRHDALNEGATPYVYLVPQRRSNTIIARAVPGFERAVIDELAAVMRDHHPDRISSPVGTLRANIDAALAPQRYMSNMALGVGITELVLAAIGLYSLLLYALLARTREVGLRIALGAAPRQASWAVIRDGMRFVIFGTVGGMLLCIPAAQYAAVSFRGARADDPLPYLTVLGAITLACAAAAIIPARRAARIEPMSALRHE